MSIHSLQMYTVGPAMSFLTSFCDLPQNEQRSVSSVRLTIGVGDLLQASGERELLVDGRGVSGDFRASDDLTIVLDALVTDERALTDHSFGNSGSALRRPGNDVCNLAL